MTGSLPPGTRHHAYKVNAASETFGCLLSPVIKLAASRGVGVRYRLRCLSCLREYPMVFRKQLCDFCSGILEVDCVGKPAVRELRKDFWSYEPLLPKGEYRHYKLGNTTLLKSTEEDLFLKLEIENPTKSFKDRGSVVEIAKAMEYGYDEVVCASTGIWPTRSPITRSWEE